MAEQRSGGDYPKRYNIDTELNNADWSKRRHWDFPELPMTEAALADFLQRHGFPPLAEFKKLPAYEGWQATVRREMARGRK